MGFTGGPQPTPLTRSDALFCMICRIADVVSSYTYALARISPTVTAIVNSSSPPVWERADRLICTHFSNIYQVLEPHAYQPVLDSLTPTWQPGALLAWR